MLVNRDREVRVLEPGHEYTGHAIGIDKNGELLVRRENGRRGIGKRNIWVCMMIKLCSVEPTLITKSII